MSKKSTDRHSFYVNAVNRYLSRHHGENLEAFCRHQRISYRLVMEAISSDSSLQEKYRSLSLGAGSVFDSSSQIREAMPLRPLILEGAPAVPSHCLRGVSVRFPDGCRLRISECDSSSLLSLLSGKEASHA